MENKNNNKIINILLKILYYIVVVFVCLIGLFLLYYIVTSQINQNKEDYHPKLSIYTIVSPSMTPTINVYDVVVNVREDDPTNIQVGDIITYISKAPNSEGMTITHRVVQVAQLPDGQYEYMTQGDNNSEPDSLYVMHDQVIGKKILIVPKIGKLQFLISEKKGWLFLLLIPVAIYIFIDVYKLIKLIKLKNKVDEITTTEEQPKDKEKEKVRKKELKEKINTIKEIKETNNKENIKVKHEKFLEEYEETIFEVKENKYNKKEKVKEPIEELESEELLNPLGVLDLDIETKTKEEPEKPKPKKSKPAVINEQYEILDTDELTSKIKEYDNKIAELDKMLKDMDKLKSKTEEKINDSVKEEVVIETNFLKEPKIRVINEEETKNKKRINKNITIEKTNVENKKVEVSIKPIVEKQIVQKEIEKKTKKERLNLNPNDIKKINRKNVSKTKEVKEKLPIDELLENKTNKKIPKKKKTVKTITVKRKPLITIERVKK